MFDVLYDLLKCFHHFASRLYNSTIPYTSCLWNCPLIKFSRLKKSEVTWSRSKHRRKYTKNRKNEEKTQLHRAMMVLDRATMKNYLFEKNLWNFGKKIDHIVPRYEGSSHGNSPGPTTLGGPGSAASRSSPPHH
jgi:hypothetical protein